MAKSKSRKAKVSKLRIVDYTRTEAAPAWLASELHLAGDYVFDKIGEVSHKEVTIVIDTPWVLSEIRAALDKIEAHWKQALASK